MREREEESNGEHEEPEKERERGRCTIIERARSAVFAKERYLIGEILVEK